VVCVKCVHVCQIYCPLVLQEYDNEAEQAICDVALHYTDTQLDSGKSSLVVYLVCNVDHDLVLH